MRRGICRLQPTKMPTKPRGESKAKPACVVTSVLAPGVVAVIELSAYIQQIPVTTSGRFHCTVIKQIMCNV